MGVLVIMRRRWMSKAWAMDGWASSYEEEMDGWASSYEEEMDE